MTDITQLRRQCAEAMDKDYKVRADGSVWLKTVYVYGQEWHPDQDGNQLVECIEWLAEREGAESIATCLEEYGNGWKLAIMQAVVECGE